ncbi:MAG: TetR/AcrR family transcriptional regulator [Dysosmobacter welbionis]
MYSAAPVRNFGKGFALAFPAGHRQRGTSTGSIYTRFTDKADCSSGGACRGELKRVFEIQESFHQFDGPTQQEEMGRYTAHAQEGLFDYIYEHLPEFELLLRRAAGTEYAHYIDELVEIEVSYTYKYMEVIGCESVRSGQVTEDLIHIVTTAYFNGMFEPVRHRMDKARALHYVRQLNRYHMAGFETIFHPENFR